MIGEYMYHRLKHKYKEFEGDKNVIVGKGELVWVGNGWINLDGHIIKDKNQALLIAHKINQLYQYNLQRLSQ